MFSGVDRAPAPRKYLFCCVTLIISSASFCSTLIDSIPLVDNGIELKHSRNTIAREVDHVFSATSTTEAVPRRAKKRLGKLSAVGARSHFNGKSVFVAIGIFSFVLHFNISFLVEYLAKGLGGLAST